MEEKTKEELLEEELKRQLQYLSEVPVGTNESKAIIDDLVELSKINAEQTKLKLEAEKIRNEKELEEMKSARDDEKLRFEEAQREDELIEESKKRRGDHLWQAIGIGASIAVAVIGNVFMGKQLGTVLKFEQTGEYVSSSAGRALIGTIFRKK